MAEDDTQNSWRARWLFAQRETRGFRHWLRELVAAGVTIPSVWLALRVSSSDTGAMEEVIAITIATAIVVVALPLVEFSWNFATAVHRLKSEGLEKHNRALQDQVEHLAEERNLWKKEASNKRAREDLEREQAKLIAEATDLIPGVLLSDKAPEEMESAVEDWRQRVVAFLREARGESAAASWNAGYYRSGGATYEYEGIRYSGHRAQLANRLDYPTRHLGSIAMR